MRFSGPIRKNAEAPDVRYPAPPKPKAPPTERAGAEIAFFVGADEKDPIADLTWTFLRVHVTEETPGSATAFQGWEIDSIVRPGTDSPSMRDMLARFGSGPFFLRYTRKDGETFRGWVRAFSFESTETAEGIVERVNWNGEATWPER